MPNSNAAADEIDSQNEPHKSSETAKRKARQISLDLKLARELQKQWRKQPPEFDPGVYATGTVRWFSEDDCDAGTSLRNFDIFSRIRFRFLQRLMLQRFGAESRKGKRRSVFKDGNSGNHSNIGYSFSRTPRVHPDK